MVKSKDYCNLKITENTYIKLKQIKEKESLSLLSTVDKMANFFIENGISVDSKYTMTIDSLSEKISKESEERTTRIIKILKNIERNFLMPVDVKVSEVLSINRNLIREEDASDIKKLMIEEEQDLQIKPQKEVSSIDDSAKNILKKILLEDIFNKQKYVETINDFTGKTQYKRIFEEQEFLSFKNRIEKLLE